MGGLIIVDEWVIKLRIRVVARWTANINRTASIIIFTAATILEWNDTVIITVTIATIITAILVGK